MQSQIMNFEEDGEIELNRLKQALIPNFSLLDHNVQNELVHLLDLLLSRPDKRLLQEFSRLGHLEEAPLLRAHLWKLLLETLPLDAGRWTSTKQANFQLYRSLCQKFLGKYVDQSDLLSLGDFDAGLWAEIELDTRRTHSVLNFFQKHVEEPKLYLSRPTKNSDVMGRILYIWGRVNPTVRYVQGMNELLAPLYYLQFQHPGLQAESEVFFMFSALMTSLIDMHIKDMDDSEHGISGRMKMLNRFLKVVDLELWGRLDSEKILPEYYSFRWLALLLGQEFGLYETMKLWDVLLSYDGYKRYFFLYCCCLGVLKYRKETIMREQFANILPAIQKLRDVNVVKVIQVALRLYEKYSKVNVDKLYHRLNEQLAAQQEQTGPLHLSKTDHEKGDKGWSYGTMFHRTSQFLKKLRPNKK